MKADLRLRIYSAISVVLASLLGRYRTKLFFERNYWRWQRLKEGELQNAHYPYFYTTAFGLTEEDYRDKDILDIGCGPRGSLDWLENARSRTGIDPLAETYLRMNPQLKMRMVAAAAEEMPFSDNAFDFVTCFNALDHVDNLEASLMEIKRVLRAGGQLLIITDIHDVPAICEPTVIDWNLGDQLSDSFDVLEEKRLQRRERIYESVREAVPYKSSSGEAYGLLMLHLQKKEGPGEGAK